MKKRCFLCSCVIYLLFDLSSSAQCGQYLLTNPGFEAPVESNLGHHIYGSAFNGWTMTGAPINIVKVNGTGYGMGPDNAKEGVQYIDGASAAATLYQDFTITGSSSPMVFGGYFSSRENHTYVDWTASIKIYSLPSNTLISTSSTRTFTVADAAYPAQEAWYLLHGFATLAPGNYRYLVNLGDYGNFDAAFIGADCILPLRLNSFTGEYANNAIKLSWKKEDHSGFAHFEIEKSADASKFTGIGKILPSNNFLYTFSDRDISTGTIYYRLKMVEIDGKISYSNIIRIHTKGTFQVQVGPNPVLDHLNISGLDKHGSVRIIDLSGRTLFKNEARSQAMSIDVSFLQKGMYLLEYFDGIQKQTQKVLKQ